MVLAGFALAFETTITLVALIPSSPAHYQLQHFKPEDIDYIDTIPDLPANLPALCTRSGLLFHSSSHYQVILTCNLALQLLKVISNDAQGGVLQCPICGPTYMPTSCPATFHEHLTTAHLAPPSSPTTSSAPPPASPTLSAPPPSKQSSYSCSLCPYTFHRRRNLAKHEKVHGASVKGSCDLCEFTGTNQQIAIHIKREHVSGAVKVGNLFQCQDCGHTERFAAKLRYDTKYNRYSIIL